jgi:hypothetical protein
MSMYANMTALSLSLCLHHDSSRWRTHVVIRTLECVMPDAPHTYLRFTLVDWGVYKIDDAMLAMMVYLQKSEEEVREIISAALGDPSADEERMTIPMLHMTAVRRPGSSEIVTAGLFCGE